MAIWFTADTHFNNQRTLEHSKRPFNSVAHMNSELVANWNKCVAKDDIVFHLGDFGDYRTAEFLNGKIYLIPGNHERADENFKDNYKYFYKVTDDIHKIKVKDYYITMAHEPSKLRDINIDENHINLFGHLHKLCMVKSYGINVGIDCHNFKLINLDDILFYHNQIFTYFDDEVFN